MAARTSSKYTIFVFSPDGHTAAQPETRNTIDFIIIVTVITTVHSHIWGDTLASVRYPSDGIRGPRGDLNLSPVPLGLSDRSLTDRRRREPSGKRTGENSSPVTHPRKDIVGTVAGRTAGGVAPEHEGITKGSAERQENESFQDIKTR